jgi:hypothetical protein
MKIKFDHDSDSTMKAIGCKSSVDELGSKLAYISVEYLKGDSQKISELCELVVNNMTDEEILYMCVQKMYSTINQSMFQMALEDKGSQDNSLLN